MHTFWFEEKDALSGAIETAFLFQSYTQYIPLSIYDLQTWMGSPSIYVYDCSNAGIIVDLFKQFSIQREQEAEVKWLYSQNLCISEQLISYRILRQAL